jgi:precorrin-6B methylase 1
MEKVRPYSTVSRVKTPLHFTARFGTHRFKAEARSGPMLAHKIPDPCYVDVLKLNIKHFASSSTAVSPRPVSIAYLMLQSNKFEQSQAA